MRIVEITEQWINEPASNQMRQDSGLRINSFSDRRMIPRRFSSSARATIWERERPRRFDRLLDEHRPDAGRDLRQLINERAVDARAAAAARGRQTGRPAKLTPDQA